ncbi:MAG TPA: PQQ-binding-like beta-propeller repeat protein [Actinomycetota bacterium]|nr:PQQ-binding-like beta-propeller repeat protein [Actinomycetota bacterium]
MRLRLAGSLAVLLLAGACGAAKTQVRSTPTPSRAARPSPSPSPSAAPSVIPSPPASSPSAAPSPSRPTPIPTRAAPPPTTPAAPATAPAPAAFPDWPTYDADAGHSAVAPASPAASTAPTAAWTSSPLDGDDHGQPLVVGGSVIAATENNSVYAFSATTGRQLWMRHLGTPMAASALPCGDITPVSGITSTPVADPAAGLVYVVAFLSSRAHTLFALHLADGSVAWSKPADAPGLNPLTEQQRSALTLANGMVYVPFGGLYGDCGTYRGAVVGFPANGSGATISYVVPSQNEAAIWAPGGAPVDSAGDLYVATGNSSSSGAFDEGNAVIRLSPSLQQLSSFAPANWAALNRGDLDLGTMSPTLLQGGQVLQVGKTGIGYLLNAANLGGVGGQLASAQVCPTAFGGTAYTAPVVYVSCTSQLVAVSVAGSGISVTWRASGFYAGPPIVADGAVWTLDLTHNTLVEINPASGAVLHTVPTNALAHFASPSASGGLIFVPGLRAIQAFRVR